MVPIKQIQPQPTLPNIGEIRIIIAQIITTKVIAPKNMECQIKAKFNALKTVGTSSKNRIREIKL